MRLWFVACLVVFSLLVPISQQAQQTAAASTVAGPKDSQAVALATNTLAVMGAGALTSQNDSKATGVLTMNFQNPISMNIVLESKGLTESRTVLEQPTGTSIRIVRNGQGALQRANGKVVQLDPRNTLVEHIAHVPVLSLLAEIQNPAAAVSLVSSSASNGTPDDVIAISFGSIPGYPTDSSQTLTLNQLTRMKFYLNHSTGLLDKVEYTRYADDGFSADSSIQEILSDYRVIAGVAVPFHRATYIDGQLESNLQLSSIAFNLGLPDSDFDPTTLTAVAQ